jgi:hypothetical protein
MAGKECVQQLASSPLQCTCTLSPRYQESLAKHSTGTSQTSYPHTIWLTVNFLTFCNLKKNLWWRNTCTYSNGAAVVYSYSSAWEVLLALTKLREQVCMLGRSLLWRWLLLIFWILTSPSLCNSIHIHTLRFFVSYYVFNTTYFGLNGFHQAYKIVVENCCSVVTLLYLAFYKQCKMFIKSFVGHFL